MRANSVKIFFVLILIGLLVYATGGNAQQSPRKASRVKVKEDTAEELLSTDKGSWQVQEQKGGKDDVPMDPLEAHMRARRMVNPNETSINRTYTSRKNADEMENEHHYRIMKLSPGTIQVTEGTEEIPEQEAQHDTAQIENIPLPLRKPVSAEEKTTAEEEIIVAKAAEETPANIPLPNRKPKPAFSPSRGLKTESITAIPLPPRKEETREVGAREEIADNDKHEDIRSVEIMHIEGVRIGEHPGKTRIVLDTDGPVEYSYGTKKNTIQIDFDNATWETQSLKKYPDHSLLNGYKAETSDSYSRMTISLTRPAKVLSTQHFSPGNDNDYHRIVIDIAPL